MIIQATKKLRCKNIVPETGAIHYMEVVSAEDEERKALADLGLWKHAGYDVLPSFLASSDDQKELLYPQSDSNPDSGMSIEAMRLKAIENTQKGYMECSLLLVLTDLINNQEFLTLQNCSRTSIQPRGIVLPPGQIVEIRRNEFKTAENVIKSGLIVARKVTNERRLFAKGILEIKKNWRILSHSSILATKKHLQHRININQLDGKERDTMYIDCSYFSSGDKLSSMDEFLVPLKIGPNGPVLGPDEESIICRTIKISLINRLSGEIISTATSWNNKNDENNKNDDKSNDDNDSRNNSNNEYDTTMKEDKEKEKILLINDEIDKVGSDNSNSPDKSLEHSAEHSSEQSTEPSSNILMTGQEEKSINEIKTNELVLDKLLISKINSHCRRRQHDAMSKRLFARLR